MYASSVDAAGYIARRERLGVFQAKPVVRVEIPPDRPLPEPRTRDWLNLATEDFATKPAWKNWSEILAEVASRYGVTKDDIISERRQKEIVAARHEYMWRLRHETPMSMEAIGRRCGGRDHSTVRSGIQAHEKRTGPVIQYKLAEVRKSAMLQREMSERELIETMILEGATTYRIRVECGVGRIKVNKIRQEMKERGVITANIKGDENGNVELG